MCACACVGVRVWVYSKTAAEVRCKPLVSVRHRCVSRPLYICVGNRVISQA